MKKIVTICAVFFAASVLFCCGSAKATTTVSIYADSLTVNSSSPIWSQVNTWALAQKAKVLSSTPIINMADGSYPGTTTMPISDDLVDMINSGTETGSGKVLAFFFDVATDFRDAANFKVSQLFTQTFTDGTGTYLYDENWNNLTTNFNNAAWIAIGGINNLSSGHVMQGYYWWWDRTADVSSYAYETAASLFVKYSTDGGANWSTPESLTVTVIPEPATMSLIGLGIVGLLRKRK